MKKVHLLCSKVNENCTEFWVLGVYSSKKKALEACQRMDVACPEIFHYTYEETVW